MKIKGRLIGIGAGPGDPELLTLKAVGAIKKCGAIAVPRSGEGESSAYSIVKKYITGQELIECSFVMERDMEKRREARQLAADRIAERLENGVDVGFITLGDPTVYSTFMYVHKIIAGMGFATEIIPGITSFSAAAAALGISLCEDGEALTVIPAGMGDTIDDMLRYPGNKVIMKSGRNLARTIDTLKARGYGGRTKIACRVTMEGEKLFASIDEYEKSPETGYLTLAIVKETET